MAYKDDKSWVSPQKLMVWPRGLQMESPSGTCSRQSCEKIYILRAKQRVQTTLQDLEGVTTACHHDTSFRIL